MAQHIPVEKIDNKRVQDICTVIRSYKYFKSSVRFFDVPYDGFKETPEDEVYACERVVPASVGVGPKAFFEVHTKPAKNRGREVTNIYLVA